MLVPVVHLLEDVPLVLLELAQRIRLDLLNFVSLPLELGLKFLDEVGLHLETLLLFSDDGLFDFGAFLCEILKDFSFFLDTGILLSL